MYNTNQIIKILETQKKELEKKYPISEMGLFGSFARGDYNEHSDIDILIDFDGRIDGFDYIKIAHHLEDAFKQKIDLVSRKGIKAKYISFVENNLIHV